MEELMIIIGILVVAILACVLWAAILTAPLMPESWDERTGTYKRCRDCSWTADVKNFREPGEGCSRCPFCHKPASKI